MEGHQDKRRGERISLTNPTTTPEVGEAAVRVYRDVVIKDGEFVRREPESAAARAAG